MPRDTSTGSQYEEIVRLCVQRVCTAQGFTAKSQQTIGAKPGGGNHRVDYVLVNNADSTKKGLISCKFQQTSGTAEEKIAYEVIKLLHAMENNPEYRHSWIVLGGDGWSPGMKNFVTKELVKWIPEMRTKINILNTDQIMQETFGIIR